jgi:hypothetical protein
MVVWRIILRGPAASTLSRPFKPVGGPVLVAGRGQ